MVSPATGDEALEATVAACRDALADRTTTEETRNVFAAYARRRDVQDTLPCIKRQIRSRTGACARAALSVSFR
ncbi:MAG: hypothetical protein ACTHKQ_25500 [Mesorhizobium sp.]